MKRLFGYLSYYKKESILGPLFKMLEAGFELFVPLVIAKMIDVGIKENNVSYILMMGGILIGLGIVGLACSVTAQYYAAKAATETGTKMRQDLFAHITGLSYREIDQVGSSTLITRMTSDINQVQTGVNMVLRLFLRSPFVVFGSMIMAFTVDARGAMLFVLAIPLLSVVVFGILLISMPLYQKVQKQLDQVMKTTRENLSGARVVRAFNRQESEREKFAGENAVLVKLQVFVGKIAALLNPLTYVMINLAIALLIYVGANQVDRGILTQGKVVALVNYMSQILVELIKLANLIIIISKSVACLGRVEKIFALEPSVKEQADGQIKEKAGAAKVSFEQVAFFYQGDQEPALTGITFQAQAGETIGIIGGTGSGKTTLVNLIPRFYDAAAGRILVDGQAVFDYPIEQLRDKIGIVPQKSVLFKGTLRDNMRWGKPDATDAQIHAALAIAQAREFVEQKGQGLELLVQQNGNNFSGGQKQRLAIARALVRQPEILILDDSASALDFATDAKLRQAIRKQAWETTVFLVSQRVGTIRQADLILVLDDGRLAGQGTHQQLLKNCSLYQEICYSQLSGEEVAQDAE